MAGSGEAGRPRWLGPLAALLILALVGYFLHRELAHFHVRDVLAQLHAIPASSLHLAFLLTACAEKARFVREIPA